jgi:hypothetical protein
MRNLLLGLVLGFFVMGCAAMTFSYNYYGLDAARYDGKLLAVDPKNDKDLSVCQPDANAKGKCIVMLGSEFYALKGDYLDAKQKLSDCQRSAK